MKNKSTRPQTLQERLFDIDPTQGGRFRKLGGDAREIAAEGIIRHLRACARMEVNAEIPAIREIIDDAVNGVRVFATTSDDGAALSA